MNKMQPSGEIRAAVFVKGGAPAAAWFQIGHVLFPAVFGGILFLVGQRRDLFLTG
jgi:hypothetical protein